MICTLFAQLGTGVVSQGGKVTRATLTAFEDDWLEPRSGAAEALPRASAPAPTMTLTSPMRRRIRVSVSLEHEAKLVVADVEHVAGCDRLTLKSLAVELDAVGRAHVDHEVLAVETLDHRVLA